jgi:class 3 adenylate cyclase
MARWWSIVVRWLISSGAWTVATVSSSSGVVALLFTDLVGSTELLDRLGDDAAEDLRRVHFSLLRQAVAATEGEEVKGMGDGLMVVFASPARPCTAR